LEDVPDTRDSLLIRVADPSDQSAWEQFARIYRPVVYNVERMRGLQDADAQDVAQQVLGMLNPTDDPEMLGRIGGYEVSGVIGSGGMGVVLKAFDGPLDRTVAIKVLAPRLASSGAARRRFAREAKAAATVLHPNVIVIHGVLNDGPLPFLVMPYIRGESLQRRLDRQGPLQTEEILRIGQQVASGLAATRWMAAVICLAPAA